MYNYDYNYRNLLYTNLSYCHLDCGNGQRGGIDLVFVLDESGSIGPSGFELIRELVLNITSVLDIGLQRSLVGVILFGSTTSLEFFVTQHTNETSLLSAINKLIYGGGGTNTAKALDLLRTAGEPGGALNLRSGFTHVAMLVTDGRSNDEQATITAAGALHASNIYDQIYAIGVSGADVTELNAVASDPSLVFFTSNFDSTGIAALQQNVTQQLKPCVGKLLIATCYVII